MARTAKPKSDVNRNVVSLKLTLRGTKPPVWRRLLVPGETTLGDLHRAIQAAMGWEDDHLHTFDIEGRQYGDPRVVDDVADEKRVTLNGLIKSGVTCFAYTYGVCQSSCPVPHQAASLILRSSVPRSGLRQTSPTGDQLRIWRDHRAGLAARASV